MKKFLLLLLCILFQDVSWGIGPSNLLKQTLSTIQIGSTSAYTHKPLDIAFLDTTIYRDPYEWPFSKKSVWNTPIGSKAVYVHAQIQAVSGYCPGAEEDVIITTPFEKSMAVFQSDDALNGGNRCQKTSNTVLMNVPIPVDFIVEPPGDTEIAAAILSPDKLTLLQTGSFAKCQGYEYATSTVIFPSVDIFGLGIEGAHRGSGLCSIGGTIRLGELVPGSRIRHALKCSVSGAANLFFSEETKGYRWPASRANDDASSTYGSQGKPVMDCRMGALLAIPYWMDIDTMGFQTEAGQIIARACQEYGMYIVDDANSDSYRICTEMSPDGRVETEFEENWGYAFSQQENKSHPWRQDIELLFSYLHVISNNTSDNVGGGGEFLAPEAPDFYKTYKLSLSTEGAEGAEISPDGTSEVVHGALIPIKVVSVPPGNMFMQWEVSAGEAIIANPNSIATTVKLLTGNAEIVAVFAAQTFDMTVYTIGSGIVNTNPSQKNYIPGSEVSLFAVADSGWVFRDWTGEIIDTRNPLEIIMNQDITITATFERAVTSIQPIPANQLRSDQSKVSVFYDSQTSHLQFKSIAGVRLIAILIYNLQGILFHKEDYSPQEEASVNIHSMPPGYYFVQIHFERGYTETYKFLKE